MPKITTDFLCVRQVLYRTLRKTFSMKISQRPDPYSLRGSPKPIIGKSFGINTQSLLKFSFAHPDKRTSKKTSGIHLPIRRFSFIHCVKFGVTMVSTTSGLRSFTATKIARFQRSKILPPCSSLWTVGVFRRPLMEQTHLDDGLELEVATSLTIFCLMMSESA